MPANEMAEVTDELLDEETWFSVAAVAAGFLASGMAQSMLEGPTPFDVPNEAYGLGVVAAAAYFDVPYRDQVVIGAGLNSVDAIAQRIGIQEEVSSF